MNVFNLLNQAALKHSKKIIFVYSLSVIFLVFYILNNLQFNTDTRDMLSEDLPWRQLDIQYESLYPHAIDNLIIVIEGQTADETEDSARRLFQALDKKSESFKSVFYLKEQEFFKRSSLLYLDEEELYELSDTLAGYQPFLSKLLADQSFGGFTQLIIEALNAKANGHTVAIEPLLNEFNKTLKAYNNHEHYQFSWQTLFSNDLNPDHSFKEIIVTQPKLNYSDLYPAENIMHEIRDMANQFGINNDSNMSIKLTGPVALAHEEFQSASQANITAIISALIIVSILLFLSLGTYKLIFITIYSLLIGLILTTAFATFAIGELNLISIAFAVLYIGLGIDFGIHYCLKFQEQLKKNIPQHQAITLTSQDISKPLFLCGITTAIGFMTFLVTDYKGVSELGLIAGFGMLISFFITLTLTPALLNNSNIYISNKTNTKLQNDWLNFPNKFPFFIVCLSIILSIFSLYLIPNVKFDYDLLNIQPKENESVVTLKALMNDKHFSPLRGVVVSDNPDDISHIKTTLQALESVTETLSIDDFIPNNQDEKLAILDELNLIMGDVFLINDQHKYNLSEINNLIGQLRALLDEHNETPLYHQLNLNLQQLSNLLSDEETFEVQIKNLDDKIFNSLAGRLNALSYALETDGLALNNLSEEFKSRWLNNNHYLIEVIPKYNLSDIENLKQFVYETQAAINTITGPPIVTIEAGNSVINAFKKAFIFAFIVVALLLFILLKNKTDVVFIMIPLVLACLFTASLSTVLGIQLNFANIIALPLLFGIGVDSAIHIVEQHHQAKSKQLLQTSSAKAIFTSALTTMLSIGNLAFSIHPGTASLGLLLVIGIATSLICTLAITPALLELRKRKNLRHP